MKGQHNNPDNIWKFIKITEDPDACWIWIGGLANSDYGRLVFNNKRYLAHRFVYEYLIGKEIPKGLVSDHLCRNRKCVNPYHLEFVTQKENVNRGLTGKINHHNKVKTHCKYGHPFDEKNTYIYKNGGRHCRKCDAIYQLLKRKKQKVALLNV